MKTSVVLSPVPAAPVPPPAARLRWRRLLPMVTVMPAIALVLSGLITWLNLGGGAGFFPRWMQAFATALPVMPLGMLTLMGLDRWLGPRLVTWPRVPATVLLAVCTAVVMELLLSCVVTLSNHGPGAAFPQSVILVNGAQSKNVFWQVGSAATINAGGGGTMVGTVISQAGVAVSTPGNVTVVTINGRVLSLGAAVTLVNTVINVPGP